MKDLKGLLQKAIISGDMESVREFYSSIFGENAPVCAVSQVSAKDAEKLIAIKKILDDVEFIEESESQDDEIEPSSNEKAGAKLKFISSSEYELPEDAIPNYQEEVKKLGTRKKQYRDSYKPNMRNCDVCGTAFDFNKEYPAGVLQSDSSIKIKCNKCRAK